MRKRQRLACRRPSDTIGPATKQEAVGACRGVLVVDQRGERVGRVLKPAVALGCESRTSRWHLVTQG